MFLFLSLKRVPQELYHSILVAADAIGPTNQNRTDFEAALPRVQPILRTKRKKSSLLDKLFATNRDFGA
jgi:hypothetical protein